MIYQLCLKNKNYPDASTPIGAASRLRDAEDMRNSLQAVYNDDYYIDIIELMDPTKTRYKMNKKIDFKMSIKEFNERCISNGQVAAEFDLRPVDMATKDGVSWNIETKDNEVYFYKVG